MFTMVLSFRANLFNVAKLHAQISTKLKKYKDWCIFFLWQVLNPSTPWLMLYLSQFVFLFEIKATNVLTEDAFL